MALAAGRDMVVLQVLSGVRLWSNGRFWIRQRPTYFLPLAAMNTGSRYTVLVCCALLPGCATHPKPDEVADDGLVRVETTMLDELYVAPSVSLAHYQRVMLDPIDIEFKDDWRLKHPDLSDRDFEHFKSQLTSDLHDTLVAELARGGYTIAEAPAQDVLRVRAGIADADFAAPEVNMDKKTAVYVDGKMTLRVQGFDAPSGALVARAKDFEEDPETRSLQRADRVTALHTAHRIFEKWAQELRSALDVARVSASARKPAP